MMKKILIGMIVAGTLCWTVTTQAAEQPQYDPKGAEGCLKCHDKGPVLDVLRTAHAMSADGRTPFADHGCETCHGPSSDHLIKPEEEDEKRIRTLFCS